MNPLQQDEILSIKWCENNDTKKCPNPKCKFLIQKFKNMPLYDYKCTACGSEREVQHSMSEIGKI